jgi:hypothetical protein
MSVEKLCDKSRVLVEKFPFAQISNNIISGIKDNDAFRLYCYLQSKTSDWEVIKKFAAKECGVAEKKAKNCWAYFNRCGLSKIQVVRDEQGKIIRHDLIILNGTQFNEKEPFINPIKSRTNVINIHRVKNPPGGETTRVEKDPLLNKDITKQRKSTKERALSENFEPNEEALALAKEKGFDWKKSFNAFKRWYAGKTKEDWDSELLIWFQREIVGQKKIIKETVFASVINQSTSYRSMSDDERLAKDRHYRELYG